jgi:hypothetical protein
MWGFISQQRVPIQAVLWLEWGNLQPLTAFLAAVPQLARAKVHFELGKTHFSSHDNASCPFVTMRASSEISVAARVSPGSGDLVAL